MLFSKADKLFRAIRKGDNKKTRTLIRKISDINCTDRDGNTPLIAACSTGNESAVKELIENGADPNIRNRDGESPLLASVRRGEFETINYLIEHNADAGAKDNVGYGVLHAAAGFGHLSILEILMPLCRGAAQPDVFGNTPLHYASMYGHYNAAEYLLANNAAPDVRNVNGATPLFEAAAAGHASVAKLLIEHGAKCSLSNNSNTLPHEIAYNNEYYDLAEFLRAGYENEKSGTKPKHTKPAQPDSISTVSWLRAKKGKPATYRVLRQTIVGDYDSRDEGLHEFRGTLVLKEGNFYLFSENLGTYTPVDGFPPECSNSSDTLSWQDYNTYGVFLEKTIIFE